MIEEIEGKLESEISSQSAKRKKNNEAMLKLIEVACQKIEERQAEWRPDTFLMLFLRVFESIFW